MNTIASLCGYIIVIVFALYTFFCFYKQKAQRTCIYIIMTIAHILLYTANLDFNIILMYLAQLVIYTIAFFIYRFFYKGLSGLILNNMIMLIMIGIFMLERIKIEYAVKQLFIVSLGLAICILVPFIIKNFPYFDKLGWQYGIIGILLLLVTFVFAEEIHGAKNWIVISGVAFQPSEFVKILYVFFAAALLTRKNNFKHIVIVTAVAVVHVTILIVEKDLGGALIFFITYLFLLVSVTGNYLYLLLGILCGLGASVGAYHLFSHVKTRVLAWKDPFSIIDTGGYQITQSMFAIASGGLFGLGLGRGIPEKIPVVESDFIFAAICEELGGIFALCLLMVYISCFIMIVNISMKINNIFFKFTALGLGIEFIFQTFLAVGGVTKFIPSTGVTLPLISYGGSSVLSTIILFSIIQGMYVLNKSEVGNDAKTQ